MIVSAPDIAPVRDGSPVVAQRFVRVCNKMLQLATPMTSLLDSREYVATGLRRFGVEDPLAAIDRFHLNAIVPVASLRERVFDPIDDGRVLRGERVVCENLEFFELELGGHDRSPSRLMVVSLCHRMPDFDKK